MFHHFKTTIDTFRTSELMAYFLRILMLFTKTRNDTSAFTCHEFQEGKKTETVNLYYAVMSKRSIKHYMYRSKSIKSGKGKA